MNGMNHSTLPRYTHAHRCLRQTRQKVGKVELSTWSRVGEGVAETDEPHVHILLLVRNK